MSPERRDPVPTARPVRPVRPADVRQRTTLGNRFRFLTRVLGLTGLLAVPAGWALAYDPLPPTAEWTAETLRAAAQGAYGLPAQVGVIAALAGGIAVLLALLVEVVGAVFLATGRKTAAGTHNAAQVVLAAALLVVVNLLSARYHGECDLTRDRQFTLPDELVADLKTLRADSPTTVVVLQLHKTAGTLSDKPDALDYAAERKVVEKVKDLVDQLRALGPRFNVAVLDVEDEDYERTVRDLTATRPGLADAIASAPENSIFFYADEKVRRVPRAEADRLATAHVAPDPADGTRALVYPGAVTRLSFTDFYQLDKTASKEATPAERQVLGGLGGGPAFAPGVRGRGNLVLIPRGKEAFVRKVLALEERRPRVALAVIHPYLTSRENFDEYTAAGLRKALEGSGFEVVDVILKRWGRGGPTPAAYTYEESELDRVEAQYNRATLLAADRELALRFLADAEKALAAAEAAKTDAERGRHVAAAARALDVFVQGTIRTEAQARQVLDRMAPFAEMFRAEQAEYAKRAVEFGGRYRDLLRNERAAENRRVADVKAKLAQYVEDCDLLIVPRLTVIDITRGDAGTIPPSLFNLAAEQAEVVKEFLKAGKPVLFAVGPTNLDRGPPAGPDDVEKLLPQLGIELGRQTILTEAEGQAAAEPSDEGLRSSVDVPPLVFDLPKDGKAPNPVAEAFRVTARAVDRQLDVKKSGYRPVYVNPAMAARLPYAAEVAFTARESWNEERPVADEEYVPKFDPAKPDDPKKGTRDEERRGPFPVGVAVEVPVPVDWYDAGKLADGSVPAAALGGAAGAYPHAAPGYGPLMAAAALAFPHDGGLFAAALTAAAQQVNRPAVRVVVLGHGGLFTGKRLDPAHEALLLHTVNWQLRRDGRLPADVPDEQKWRYPRADLGRREFWTWALATVFGFPALTLYVGFIALMVRRLR